MGKFYLENKHIWFKHLAERAHSKKMEEGGCLAGFLVEICELRFFYKLEGDPPRSLQLYDGNTGLISVQSGNGYVGDLDAESSEQARQFFAANPHLHGLFPATYIRTEEFSGAHILQLGFKEK